MTVISKDFNPSEIFLEGQYCSEAYNQIHFMSFFPNRAHSDNETTEPLDIESKFEERGKIVRRETAGASMLRRPPGGSKSNRHSERPRSLPEDIAEVITNTAGKSVTVWRNSRQTVNWIIFYPLYLRHGIRWVVPKEDTLHFSQCIASSGIFLSGGH